MNHCLLFDVRRIAARKTPEKLRNDLILKAFGSTIHSGDMPSVQKCEKAMSALPDQLFAEWRRAVAEELLLWHAVGRKPNQQWIAAFKKNSPFANDVSLEKYLQRRCACAVFPLSNLKNPEAGHVWVIERQNPASVPDQTAATRQILYDLCFLTVQTEWCGQSWELAARLALRCIIEKNTKAASSLAREWIVTGSMDNTKVLPVNLGNKLQLTVKRKWIIPLDNIKDVPSGVSALTIRSAVNEDSAWANVTGEGLQSGGDLEWPSGTKLLHILVGGNIKASIVSALFMPHNSVLELWHSKGSATQALAVRLILKQLRKDLNVGYPRPISSASLIDAERALRHVLKKTYCNDKTLFNVTSGNLLMRLAADSCARRYPNIMLIYRDIDAEPSVFTRIDYQRFPHESGTYRGDEAKLNSLNIRFLFDATPCSGRTAEAISRNFLAHCFKKRK